MFYSFNIEHEIKQTINSKIGFNRGLEPHHILGAREINKKLMFFIVWKDPENNEPTPEFDMVAATEVYEKAPQIAINFFEKHLIIPKKSK